MAVVKVPRRKPKRRKVRIWPQSMLEWCILLLIAGLVLLMTGATINPVWAFITNPWFFAMLVLLIVEFLIIKSADRSKVYQSEARQLQQAQDKWNLRRGRALEQLSDARRALEQDGASVYEAREKIEQAIETLRKR